MKWDHERLPNGFIKKVDKIGHTSAAIGQTSAAIGHTSAAMVTQQTEGTDISYE